MAEQSPDYKKEYLEEQRIRKIAEHWRDMAEQMLEIAERRQKTAECALGEEQRKHEEAEQSPDYQKKYLEEQRRREIAVQRLYLIEQKLDLAEEQEITDGRRELAEGAHGKEQRKHEEAEQSPDYQKIS